MSINEDDVEHYYTVSRLPSPEDKYVTDSFIIPRHKSPEILTPSNYPISEFTLIESMHHDEAMHHDGRTSDGTGGGNGLDYTKDMLQVIEEQGGKNSGQTRTNLSSGGGQQRLMFGTRKVCHTTGTSTWLKRETTQSILDSETRQQGSSLEWNELHGRQLRVKRGPLPGIINQSETRSSDNASQGIMLSLFVSTGA